MTEIRVPSHSVLSALKTTGSVASPLIVRSAVVNSTNTALGALLAIRPFRRFTATDVREESTVTSVFAERLIRAKLFRAIKDSESAKVMTLLLAKSVCPGSAF
jgi:hypothetical protein